MTEAADQKTRQNVDMSASDAKQPSKQVDEEYESPNEEQIITVKDLCRVVRTDIKRKPLLKKLQELVFYSVGCVLGNEQYRKILQNTKDKEMPKKMQEFLDQDSCRKEIVNLLSKQVNIRGKLPHYVILFGQDFDQAIKYSRGSLLQLLVCKKYGLTLYEVPSLAISRLGKRLTEADLKPKKKADEVRAEKLFKHIEVKELECFASDDRISARFKDKWVEALKDVTKFSICQSLLSNSGQDKAKLAVLSSLMLSRNMKHILEFKEDADTASLNTGFNWNVVLGETTQPKNQQYTVNSSHPHQLNNFQCKILYYQKLECKYLSITGHTKKCECVIFCQHVESKSMTVDEVVESVRTNIFTVNGLYYVMFFLLMFGVILGSKVCAKLEDAEMNKTPEQELLERSGVVQSGWQHDFCEHKNSYTLNMGVIVLVLGAGKKYLGDLSRKSKQN